MTITAVPPTVPDETLFSPDALADPYPALRSLRKSGPIHHLVDQDLYLVVAHDAIREVVGDPGLFSSNIVGVLQRGAGGVSFAGDMPAGSDVLATADAPEHSDHRNLVRKRFDRRRIAELTSLIDNLAAPRIAALAADGSGDWMSAVAGFLPVRVIVAMMGLPSEDADLLARWSDDAVELLAGTVDTERFAEVVAGVGQFADYLRRQLAHHADPQGESILDSVAGAVARGELTVEQGVLFALQLVTAGAESTTSLIGTSVRLLADDPELQRRVRADGELIPALIEEAVRLESPFRGHFRVSTAPASLAGYRLPAGARLMLLWGSANRDSDTFDNPDSLDLARPNIKVHNSFGHGVHYCIGAHLARLEAHRAVAGLLAATDQFTVGAAPEYVPSLFVRRLATLELELTPIRSS